MTTGTLRRLWRRWTELLVPRWRADRGCPQCHGSAWISDPWDADRAMAMHGLPWGVCPCVSLRWAP